MLQAEAMSSSTRRFPTRLATGTEISPGRDVAGQAMQMTAFALGIACMLIVHATAAPALEREHMNEILGGADVRASCTSEVAASAFDPSTLPSIESIDAQTDITMFLQSGVPTALQVAALRRAWTVDPAIRDFKGLQENDWDFDRPNSIAGFGELGPEVDKTVVVQISGEAPPAAARTLKQPEEPRSFSFLATAILRRFFDVALN